MKRILPFLYLFILLVIGLQNTHARSNNAQSSIITDYLGTPVEMYNSKGQKTWEVEYDIYGKVRKLVKGSLEDCPFRYQGQYEDEETMILPIFRTA